MSDTEDDDDPFNEKEFGREKGKDVKPKPDPADEPPPAKTVETHNEEGDKFTEKVVKRGSGVFGIGKKPEPKPYTGGYGGYYGGGYGGYGGRSWTAPGGRYTGGYNRADLNDPMDDFDQYDQGGTTDNLSGYIGETASTEVTLFLRTEFRRAIEQEFRFTGVKPSKKQMEGVMQALNNAITQFIAEMNEDVQVKNKFNEVITFKHT